MDKPKPMLNPVVVQQTHPEVTTRDITDQTSYLNRSDLSGKTRGAQVFYQGEVYTAQGSEPTSPWVSGATTIRPSNLYWCLNLGRCQLKLAQEFTSVAGSRASIHIKLPEHIESKPDGQVIGYLTDSIGDYNINERGYTYFKWNKGKLQLIGGPNVDVVAQALPDSPDGGNDVNNLKLGNSYNITITPKVAGVKIGTIGSRFSGHEAAPDELGLRHISFMINGSWDGVDTKFYNPIKPPLPKAFTSSGANKIVYNTQISSLPVWRVY